MPLCSCTHCVFKASVCASVFVYSLRLQGVWLCSVLAYSLHLQGVWVCICVRILTASSRHLVCRGLTAARSVFCALLRSSIVFFCPDISLQKFYFMTKVSNSFCVTSTCSMLLNNFFKVMKFNFFPTEPLVVIASSYSSQFGFVAGQVLCENLFVFYQLLSS